MGKIQKIFLPLIFIAIIVFGIIINNTASENYSNLYAELQNKSSELKQYISFLETKITNMQQENTEIISNYEIKVTDVDMTKLTVTFDINVSFKEYDADTQAKLTLGTKALTLSALGGTFCGKITIPIEECVNQYSYASAVFSVTIGGTVKTQTVDVLLNTSDITGIDMAEFSGVCGNNIRRITFDGSINVKTSINARKYTSARVVVVNRSTEQELYSQPVELDDGLITEPISFIKSFDGNLGETIEVMLEGTFEGGAYVRVNVKTISFADDTDIINTDGMYIYDAEGKLLISL